MKDSQSQIDTAELQTRPDGHAKRAAGRGFAARALAILFCLATAALFVHGPARAETRSLKIYNVHTGEKDVIAYKRNGHYVSAGLKKLNYILRDWRKNKEKRMDPRLLDLLWAVYAKSGSSDYIHIICGYRTADTNAMLRGRSRSSGVAKKSQHILGKAADFYIPDVKLEKLREIGMKFQVGGVGYYPRSGSPFVHMDTGWVRAWPRMSRQQLVRLFPDGKTLHLPPDGKRFSGYQQALASYKRRVSDDSIMVAGGSDSGSHGSGGNLLAALFGGGGKGGDAITTGSISPRQQTTASAAGVELPDRAPLPGVRAAKITASASASAADSAAPQAPDYIDLVALASVPIPQVAPGREDPDVADAIAAPVRVAALGPHAAAPVPKLRPEPAVPELVAYAPAEDAIHFPSPGKVTVPSLRPSAIVASARTRMDASGLHSAAQALAARLEKTGETKAQPRAFATISGDTVRGARRAADPGGSPGLSEAMIARWAHAQERYAGRLDDDEPASRRMSRLAPEPQVSRNEEPQGRHRPVDPQRFAALAPFFTAND